MGYRLLGTGYLPTVPTLLRLLFSSAPPPTAAPLEVVTVEAVLDVTAGNEAASRLIIAEAEPR